MEIYTSYFGNLRALRSAGIMPISIARWKPKFYEGACMYSVAPTKYMLSDDCEHEEYIELYQEILNRKGASSIISEIRNISQGRDCALLCYEKPEDFCHRHLLADFLNKRLSLNVREYVAPIVPSKPQPKQTSLF